MLGGCEIRFREIQVARDELLFQSPWAAHQAAGSSPRRAGVRRRPRWSHEMPPGRDEHEWGEFWGAEERRKKGYEADGGHWYDREEESSDIQQHMLVLGAGTAAKPVDPRTAVPSRTTWASTSAASSQSTA